jgi:hypothetical protein
MNNAFSLLNGDGYEHRIIQPFLRYFVTVNAIILSTNGFELYKNPHSCLMEGFIYLPVPMSSLQILDFMQIKL